MSAVYNQPAPAYNRPVTSCGCSCRHPHGRTTSITAYTLACLAWGTSLYTGIVPVGAFVGTFAMICLLCTSCKKYKSCGLGVVAILVLIAGLYQLVNGAVLLTALLYEKDDEFVDSNGNSCSYEERYCSSGYYGRTCTCPGPDDDDDWPVLDLYSVDATKIYIALSFTSGFLWMIVFCIISFGLYPTTVYDRLHMQESVPQNEGAVPNNVTKNATVADLLILRTNLAKEGVPQNEIDKVFPLPGLVFPVSVGGESVDEEMGGAPPETAPPRKSTSSKSRSSSVDRSLYSNFGHEADESSESTNDTMSSPRNDSSIDSSSRDSNKVKSGSTKSRKSKTSKVDGGVRDQNQSMAEKLQALKTRVEHLEQEDNDGDPYKLESSTKKKKKKKKSLKASNDDVVHF